MTQMETAPRISGRWVALALLCLAQFMLIVDLTVVQVALPSIGDDLALARGSLTWVVTAYTLFFGGLMILGGRLADTFGARRVLLAGLALFVVASLVAGTAREGAQLVAGRALQGIGAALMSPSALAIITTSFKGAERHRALGIWSAIGGAGAAVGVLIGGVLTAGPGWQWVFYVNVPVGLAVLLTLPAVVAGETATRRESVDLPGAATVTAATALLIYGLVRAGDSGWASAATIASLSASLLLYAGFLALESRVQAPLVRPETLARRAVLSGGFVMVVATGLMLGLFFLTSLYLQQNLELNALRTRLVFLPVALALTAGAHVGGRLVSARGGRPVAVTGFALAAVGAASLARISPGGSVLTDVLPGFLVAALGIGALFVTAFSTTLANVPHDEAGVASGVVSTFHELGGAIGVAVVSTVAAGSIALGAGAGAATPAVDGFAAAFTLCAVAAVVAALAALGIVPRGRPVGAVGHGH